jgi:NAD(P)-dependent dehydrogenase (short-subunit alcohol dehydrogenase family)
MIVGPREVWALVFLWLGVVGILLQMSMFGFVILSVVAQIPTFDKIKAFRKDPMNTIMRAFGVLCLGLGIFSYYFDRPITSVCIFYTLWIAAYVAAPSRRYQTASKACRDMTGKTVMVTGCTSGIGVDTVKALAKRGAHVYMVARSAEKLKRLKDSIKGKCETIVCDLSDLKAVRNCAKIFLSDVSSGKISGLDVLILNAGVMALEHREETQQGFEKQVGVNHIAHFTLTKLLLPALQRSAPSRIVSVSSSAHRMCDPVYILDQQNVNLETIPYDPWIAYGNSKYSNVLFVEYLNRMYAGEDGRGVTAYAVMPGGIFTGLQGSVRTSIMAKWMVVAPFFFKSTSQGASTTLTCATAPGIEKYSGRYFENCKPSKPRAFKKLKDIDSAKILWQRTESLVKNYSGSILD